ncbi:MAG: hypothetical protein AAFV07_20350, partial [Bacteroidota bacterium]
IRNICYIAYVFPDATSADLSVIVTRVQSGGNGRIYTFDVAGLKDFEGQKYQLDFTILPNTSRDKERGRQGETLAKALLPFLMQTGGDEGLEVKIKALKEQAQPKPERDPWGYWVFDVNVGGRMNREARRSNLRGNGNIFANRVTEAWRIRSNTWFNYSYQQFFNEEETIVNEQRNQGWWGSVVKSIDNHWSIGFSGSARSSVFQNMALSWGVSPALEYSLFPYQDVNRREVTLAYKIGPSFRTYIEETIYGETEEMLWRQSLDLAVRIRQPWGSVFAGVEGGHFFHDLSKNRLSMDGRLNLRVVKGLAISLSGNVDFIRDQLSLPKGEVSLEDLLLQQTQLATNYRMAASVGFNYTFGAIYNNTINTRL